MLKLKLDSLDWALNLALKYRDTDIFPSVFEFEAIQHNNSLISKIADENILEWSVRGLRKCLTPKHRYGFRVATQLDPLDFLIYTALVYEIGSDLENRRIPINEGIVHSYRFSPNADGQIYDVSFNYSSFNERTKQILQDSNFRYVLVADIADFFPKIYTHRVENALRLATTRTNHAKAINDLIKQWNFTVSYGIPVGPTVSRLIAEVTISDVDQALLSEKITYVRFSDDFRIFCRSQREAYKYLVFLANVLFDSHGLTLQQHKTRILTTELFEENYLYSEDKRVLRGLSKKFNEIVPHIGYEKIRWTDLTSEQQSQIQSLSLVEILQEQASSEEIDVALCRKVLQILTQLDDAEAISIVSNNIDNLYPVFPYVVDYIKSVSFIEPQRKIEIGTKIRKLLDDSNISHLEFHRMWLLSIFSQNAGFNQEQEFATLHSKYTDSFSSRELILGLGSSHQDYWFSSRKQKVFELEPWQRRAVLFAGSCMGVDERKHWYDFLEPRLDPLELAVTKFARANPI